MTAMVAGLLFDPEEILDVSLRGAAFQTSGAVEGAYLRLQAEGKIFRRFSVLSQIEMLDFTAHNPVGHRIDVIASHIATNAVSLDERRAAPHEGIGNGNSFQVV